MDTDANRPVALVVGGGSGIGAAVAARERDTEVPTVVWDIAGERDVTCDVADPDAIDRAIAETLETVGTPTRVTVCAGIGHSGMLLDTPPGEWDRVMNVNARGAWLSMRAAANAMRAAEVSGSIVAISSVSARIPDRTMGLYCASKAALEMIMRVAAAEWATDGIRVNAVGPGATLTPMLLGPVSADNPWLQAVRERTPLERLGEPDDIAEAVLAVHGLGWVTGQVLEADGGLSLASPLDPYGEAVRQQAARSGGDRERER